MTTLLLRLAGPMQSWGLQSRFTTRDTGHEPSKSGVIGLLCAALGRPRDAALDDLAALVMGVRVNREGILRTDYHTAGGHHLSVEASYGVARFGGAKPDTVQSWRRYLADADFLVGLEAGTADQEALLRQLDQALAHPIWPLYLGRKAFVPGRPIRLPDSPPWGPGIQPLPLREALRRYPWPTPRPGDHAAERPTSPLRAVIEDPSGTSGEIRLDVPVSFAPLDRRYLPRAVRTEELTPAPGAATIGSDSDTLDSTPDPLDEPLSPATGDRR
jgi:CRISPR system Cascade subunit CasD